MSAEKNVAGTPTGDNEHSDVEAQSPRHSSSSSSTIQPASEGQEDPATTPAGAQKNEADETDGPIVPVSSVVIVPDEVYSRYTPRRKATIVALLSFCAFLAPISSTSSLSATPEIAAEYNTTGSILNVASALYMLFMGLSPMFWGPLSEVFGRRIITLIAGCGFLAFSIATALAPEIASFFVFRILTAIAGTAYVLTGPAVVSDIYPPVERGTATGSLLIGMLVGPALGPFISGVIVTYTSWRVIFWLQTALAGVALVGVIFILPETKYHRKWESLAGYSGKRKARTLCDMVNPWRVIRLWQYPNLLLTGLASAALLWNMYGLLAPIRYVLNPRYNLTSPMQGGLFYLAPGLGYLTGTFLGGRYADYIVRKYIKKRGVRIAEDRLISAVPFLAVVAACILVYGWTVEKDVGGIPLTVICMYVQGVAQLFCFPSLNAYCLDVMPGYSSEVIGANYSMRYLFATVSTAVVLPAIQHMGVGGYSTLSSVLILGAMAGTLITVRYGKSMREAVDERRRKEKEKAHKLDVEPGLAGYGNSIPVIDVGSSLPK